VKAQNTMKLTIESLSINEGFARSVICAFAAQLDPTIDVLSDIRTALSEAVTNCVVHAYKNGTGAVYITAALYPDGRIRIKVRDKGCGIEDLQKAMEPLFTTADGERAGLGFAVMQSLMDKVTVRSKPGSGTTVTLEKRIGSAHEG
jgi:stage II sporulation protein AB (anti-sigma F factor)